MTVTAPPRLPRRSHPDDLEALIEEARRRARRRRLWYAAAVLLTTAGAVAIFGFGHGGGAHRPTARDESPAAGGGNSDVRTSIAPVARPGQLTIIGVPSHNGEGAPGWYDLSTVVRGGLHPFIRCPRHAAWCGDVLSVAWARDGTRLAFSVTSIGGTAEFNGLHIVSLRTRHDFWMLIPSENLGPENLEWSPDGSKLAFDSAGSIYVLDVTNMQLKRLRTGTPSGAFDSSPSWSSDGTRLVFATQRQQHSSIFLTNLDGSRRRLLATGGTAPAWSPDGRAIAYRAPCGIKLITPVGTDVTPANVLVCHAVGVAGDPVWSPDGKKIAILGARSFTPGTFIMDADGTHLTLLTRATGRALTRRADASWQPQPHT